MKRRPAENPRLLRRASSLDGPDQQGSGAGLRLRWPRGVVLAGSNLVAAWQGGGEPPAVDWKEPTSGDLLERVGVSQVKI